MENNTMMNEEKSIGPTIAIVIIAVIIITGATYFWNKNEVKETPPPPPVLQDQSEQLNSIDLSSDKQLDDLEKQF
ncbi:MAG: hypothetical protein PHS95_02245 [Candidatus Pacebacteria bacterium]|nr:hypothetical protein [Candidatus Paceibacterota bacterium]